MIFIDCETVGLAGQPVLIQWAEDDGEVNLHSVWSVPISETLALIEKFCKHEDGLVFFNAAFDWFMLCKIYTLLDLYPDKDAYPEDIINELAELEMQARDGPCLKPVKCHDVFLHARKTSYQSTMERGDVRIRKVPTPLAWQLAAELERRIQLKDIYFARKKDKVTKWNVYDIESEPGIVDPNFKDVVLKFAPSAGLKALAVDALGLKDVLIFSDIEVDKAWLPKEFGWAPFAKAAGGDRFDWKGAWPEVIKHHIAHWNYHTLARKYAAKDVEYTRSLYKFFGSPPLGDDDSELACMVAAVRWRGFKIDVPKLRELKHAAEQRIKATPTAPNQVRFWIEQALDGTEKVGLKGSTAKITLEAVAKLTRPCPKCNVQAEIDFKNEDVHDELLDAVEDITTSVLKVEVTAKGNPDCQCCNGKGTIQHPAAERAQAVLDARAADKEIELYDKLIQAGRFHVSLKVIGTLSSRMSGADGLNPQGIKKAKETRRCFPLALDGMILCGGDYAGFEVTLAEACYNDPDLRNDLLTCEVCGGSQQRINESIRCDTFLDREAFEKYVKARLKTEDKLYAKSVENRLDPKHQNDPLHEKKPEAEIREECFENDFICTSCGSNKGKKIHALFGVNVFPDMTYEQIKATDGTGAGDIYTRCKQAVFAMFYGGEGKTLQDRLGVDLETADEAVKRFYKKYKQVGVARKVIFDQFCVTKDTWVQTTEGPRQVFELVGKPFEAVVNGVGYKASGFFSTGKKKIFEVLTKNGYKLKLTEDHPLLVNYFQKFSQSPGLDLWQKVKDLKIGDLLHLNNHQNLTWEGFGDFDEGYLVGWLFGDGSVASKAKCNRLIFYKDDFEMMPYLCDLMGNDHRLAFVPQTNSYYLSGSRLDYLVDELGIKTEKNIDHLIESASSEFLSGFLSAYFDTDGSSRGSVKQIDLHQSSKEKLEAIQRILLRFGIVSHINQVAKAGTSEILGRKVIVKDAYRLAIYKEGCITFQKRIGFKNTLKAEKLKISIQDCDPKKIYKEYFLTKVKSITPLEEEEVFDVTVENIHAFDANGLLAHNCSMRQTGGIGTRIEWHEPSEYIESMFGFRRYFTLENNICRALFELAEKPPKSWRDIKIKVVRRDRVQFADGAARSAIFASAFALQASNMRAAANHVIQSSGAQITKGTQRAIWDIQPSGVNPWLVQCFNIHDEIQCACDPSVVDRVAQVVKDKVEEYRPKVPLIKIEWSKNMNSWADK